MFYSGFLIFFFAYISFWIVLWIVWAVRHPHLSISLFFPSSDKCAVSVFLRSNHELPKGKTQDATPNGQGAWNWKADGGKRGGKGRRTRGVENISDGEEFEGKHTARSGVSSRFGLKDRMLSRNTHGWHSADKDVRILVDVPEHERALVEDLRHQRVIQFELHVFPGLK